MKRDLVAKKDDRQISMILISALHSDKLLIVNTFVEVIRMGFL